MARRYKSEPSATYKWKRLHGQSLRHVVRPTFWHPKSSGRAKLKRVLYRMRWPVGRLVGMEHVG